MNLFGVVLAVAGGYAIGRAIEAQGHVPLDLAFKEPLTPIRVLRARIEAQGTAMIQSTNGGAGPTRARGW